jgi:hypothetical protein
MLFPVWVALMQEDVAILCRFVSYISHTGWLSHEGTCCPNPAHDYQICVVLVLLRTFSTQNRLNYAKLVRRTRAQPVKHGWRNFAGWVSKDVPKQQNCANRAG